ncbi:MAG: hypothetical protein ABI651_01890 [Verrucomicrobiota bacterium]
MTRLDSLFFDFDQLALFQSFAVFGSEVVRLLLREKIVVILAKHFVVGIAEQFLPRLVPPDETEFLSLFDEDDNRQDLDHGVQEGPCVPQLFFFSFALSDVSEDATNGDRFAVVKLAVTSSFDRDIAPILAQ